MAEPLRGGGGLAIKKKYLKFVPFEITIILLYTTYRQMDIYHVTVCRYAFYWFVTIFATKKSFSPNIWRENKIVKIRFRLLRKNEKKTTAIKFGRGVREYVR